jgi:hypothetical protein
MRFKAKSQSQFVNSLLFVNHTLHRRVRIWTDSISRDWISRRIFSAFKHQARACRLFSEIVDITLFSRVKAAMRLRPEIGSETQNG